MELAAAVLPSLVPSWSAVAVLLAYFGYLAAAGAVLPGKLVAGAVLPDASRLHYRCNGLLSLLLLLGLTALGVYMGWMSPTVVADRGLELLTVTFIFSVLVGGASHFTMFLFLNDTVLQKFYNVGNNFLSQIQLT